MGKRMERNKKIKDKQNNVLKLMILFTVLGIITVLGSGLLAMRIFSNTEPVDNKTVVQVYSQTVSKETINKGKNTDKKENIVQESKKNENKDSKKAETKKVIENKKNDKTAKNNKAAEKKKNTDIKKSNEAEEKKKSEKTKTNKTAETHKNVSKDNSNKLEDVKYLENYLGQQVAGKIPDGADGKKVVYLTFDDGPSTTVTPYILNILKRENVKATFFVLGQHVDKNNKSKEIIKREFKEGHAIANHTYSHDYDYLYPNRNISANNFLRDIEKTNNSLKNVLGKDFSTRVIRFPGGYTSWNDPDNVGNLLKSKGYYYIDWNSLSKDSEGSSKSKDELIDEIKASVKGREKAVILMHDTYGKEETAKALPEIIKYLKQQGYEFRTIK